jgi:hypothetical protein
MPQPQILVENITRGKLTDMDTATSGKAIMYLKELGREGCRSIRDAVNEILQMNKVA